MTHSWPHFQEFSVIVVYMQSGILMSIVYAMLSELGILRNGVIACFHSLVKMHAKDMVKKDLQFILDVDIHWSSLINICNGRLGIHWFCIILQITTAYGAQNSGPPLLPYPPSLRSGGPPGREVVSGHPKASFALILIGGSPLPNLNP
ncbi:hypothetical protein BT96DRAFT_945232 [Gymnopus androsaceus JB14]|uniref:Uncharacterized protein n=1 Tax=Gymnopus androsaceus JB14 TaxID=1447944 RepID=A0A6A4H1W2_9AGAR|nr:hypothetical protein BT96DRAFT_945232 [Gymnopus androsaceus JB14]